MTDLTPSILAEVERALTQPQLLELAKAPLTGLPRVERQRFEVDVPRLAQALLELDSDFQLGRLAFLVSCMKEQWPRFDTEGRLALALVTRLEACLLRAAKSSRILIKPPERMDFRTLVEAVGIRWDEGVPALLGAHLLCMGAMSLLVGHDASRRRARSERFLRGAAQIVSETVAEAEALVMLLDASDQQRLFLAYPERSSAFIVEVCRIRNGFQLFAMLDALQFPADPRGAFPAPAPWVMPLATGEAPPNVPNRVTSPLGFYNWSAWTNTGLAEDRAARLIWGEQPISLIPAIDGMPIVVRGTPWLDRGWPPSLITPIHPAYIPAAKLVQPISPQEFEGWRRKILQMSPAERQSVRAS